MLRNIGWLSLAFLLTLALASFTLEPSFDENVTIVLEFLGSFHPLILHLPIGLWFGVLCLLAVRVWFKDPLLLKVAYWATLLTLYTGFGAFGAGFMLYLAGGYSVEVLAPHMYGSLAFLVGVAVQAKFLKGNQVNIGAYLVATITSALLGYAGHIGGVITHGEPMDKAPWVVFEKRKQAAANAPKASAVGEEKVFEHLVYPIIDSKCINCHGIERAKGKLRMDSIAALIKGGSKGTSLVVGDPKSSLMIERIHLPLQNREHMPPKDKLQLTADELSFLEWWIADGAKQGQLVKEANIPSELKPYVQSHLGDDPEAVARREAKVRRDRLMEHYEVLRHAFPGVMVQSVQGKPIFELSSASIYNVDEEKLRQKLAPLAEDVVRLDWVNRAVEPEWYELFLKTAKLEILNLSLSSVTGQQLTGLLKAHAKVQKLNLTGTDITDAVLAELSAFIKQGHLKVLILTETKLSQQSLNHLKTTYPNLNLIF